MDFVLLDHRAAVEAGLHVEQEAAATPLKEFVDRHRDIVKPTCVSLVTLAKLTVAAMLQKREELYTKERLRKLLREAVAAGRIDKNDLKPGVQRHIP